MKKSTKIVAAAIIVPLLGAVLFLNIVLSFIDREQYAAELKARALEATGRELVIKGTPSLSIIPRPSIHFPYVELAQPPENGKPRIVANKVTLGIPWSKAFVKNPPLEYITLTEPSIDVERGETDEENPKASDESVKNEWLTLLLTAFRTPEGRNTPIILEVENGKYFYRNSAKGISIRADNVRLEAHTGGDTPASASGDMLLQGKPASFNLTLGMIPGAPVRFEASYAQNARISVEATRTDEGDAPRIAGKLDAAITDITLFSPEAGETPEQPRDEPSMLAKFTQGNVQKTAHTALALSLKGNISIAPELVSVTSGELLAATDKAAAELHLRWDDTLPRLELKTAFETFRLTPWTGILSRFTEKTQTPEQALLGIAQESPFAQDFSIGIDASADTLIYGERNYSDITMQAEIADGALTLHQIRTRLPGEASVSVFGVVTQQPQGLRFEGSGELEGESLSQTLSFFDSAAEGLPERAFGKYSTRANLFISAEQLRLSEAAVKIGDLSLIGGLVTYFEATPRVEAEMRFQDSNLDFFRDVWRSEREVAGPSQFKFFSTKGTEFGWLKRLNYIIDLKLSLEGFTFLEHPGQTAAMRVYVKKNEFNLLGVRMYFPEGVLDANFRLNVAGERPLVDVMVNTPFFDTSYFDPEPEKTKEETTSAVNAGNEKEWSNNLFDFSWITLFGGNIDLSLAQFRHGDTDFNNFKLRAQVHDQVFSIQNLGFEQFGGRVQATGSLIGGKVPGLSISFTVYNADIAKIAEYVPTLARFSGRLSLSGFFSTSGIHLLSWIKQAEAKVVMAGRGVKVGNFNLEAVTDAVQSSRSTADVVTAVAQRLQDGKTEFSIDGNINILGGRARTPGITLKSGITIGNMSGEIDIIPKKMNLTTLFQFPQLSTETIPTLQVVLSGPVDSPTMETDTSSLEAYVAKRIVGQ